MMSVKSRELLVVAALMVTAATSLLASGPAPERRRHPDFATGTRRPNRPTIAPTIPLVDRAQSDKVFLEHADTLRYRQIHGYDPMSGRPLDQYQVLVGDVKFRKGGMVMTCDSAYFYEGTNSFDAFSRVKMEQGDTLFVYCDELNYDGEQEQAVAVAYNGRKVRLINRDVTLTTEILNYDMNQEVGYYTIGGVLSDKQNTLISREGEYFPSTKQSYFYRGVVLAPVNPSDPSRLYTDTLEYNTATHIAEIVDKTLIVGKDGDISTTSGNYNTETGVANLYRRSTVKMRRGNTLTGDTIDYSRDTGIGIAMGNVVMTDSARRSSVEGMYAFYDENIDSAFVTGMAVAKEYSKGDTLYLHGDTINAYTDPVDSARVTNAFHRVRFYRSDMQGICDSLSFIDLDSTIYMYRAPVVWNADRQIFGEAIELRLNDSTVERAYLPEAGFIAEHIAEDCYNQLSGKDIKAWFANSELSRLTVDGNLQMIMFPMENDSTYNKYAFIESTSMDARFKDNTLSEGLIWPENTGHVTPLYLARPGSYFLEKFAWYEPLRPQAPGDIFIIPEQMIAMIAQAPPVKPRKREPRRAVVEVAEEEALDDAEESMDEGVESLKPEVVATPVEEAKASEEIEATKLTDEADDEAPSL
ncbi:MAG: hypothetical protein NC342_02875 [Pseudoflavonifractor sp.]|nr:hypothetical protein [Alloprevotella sp.]MCM1116457.1 hypothetical protein [Pseudoflavonifractor sp.]